MPPDGGNQGPHMRVYYSSEDFSLTSEGDKTTMSRFPRVAAVALTASLLIPAGGLAASDASAEYMAADPLITDPIATPWERLEIGPDGQSLRVYFSTGAAGCNGLARVEVWLHTSQICPTIKFVRL